MATLIPLSWIWQLTSTSVLDPPAWPNLNPNYFSFGAGAWTSDSRASRLVQIPPAYVATLPVFHGHSTYFETQLYNDMLTAKAIAMPWGSHVRGIAYIGTNNVTRILHTPSPAPERLFYYSQTPGKLHWWYMTVDDKDLAWLQMLWGDAPHFQEWLEDLNRPPPPIPPNLLLAPPPNFPKVDR